MYIPGCSHYSNDNRISHWSEKISAAQTAHIKETFHSDKSMCQGTLAIPPHTSADSTDSTATVSKTTASITTIHHVFPVHTGYARIDNAITDALRGKSQELKDNVYLIIQNDFLPHEVHGLTEDDRLAQIGLGVEKARYLSEQFMDQETGHSFMEAMEAIARIGTKGTRVGTCEMEYNVKHAICLDGNGYVHDGINLEETLFAMEKHAPKDYNTYKEIRKSSEDGNVKAALFALRWTLDNLSLLAPIRDAFNRHRNEQYEQLKKVKLNDTFSGIDISNKEQFLISAAEKLKSSQILQQNYFLQQLANMARVSGNYLSGRQTVLFTRA